jgi:hypothetical protein
MRSKTADAPIAVELNKFDVATHAKLSATPIGRAISDVMANRRQPRCALSQVSSESTSEY